MSVAAPPCLGLHTATRRRLYTCVAGLLLLVLLLAGHVATLAYAYHDHHHQRHLLLGGAVLCSVLLLLPLALLLPHRRTFLRWAWLAVHVTYSDDLAHRALRVLYDLQVRPLLYALGLVHPDPQDTLDYWWWALQGLVLATLAGLVSGPTTHDDDDDDDDHDDDHLANTDPEVNLRKVVEEQQQSVEVLALPPSRCAHHPVGVVVNMRQVEVTVVVEDEEDEFCRQN